VDPKEAQKEKEERDRYAQAHPDWQDPKLLSQLKVRYNFHIGCVRLLVRTGPDRYWNGPEKRTVRAVPVPLCGPTVG
jgi:hypothetical protein